MNNPATCPDCGAGQSHFYTVHQPRNGGPSFSYCDACHKRFGATSATATPRVPLTAAETAQAHRGYRTAALWAAVQLWAPGGAHARAYLRGRGLTDDTIRAAQLGYHPVVAAASSSGLGDALYRADPDAYTGATLGGILGKQGRVMSMMHEAVTLPYTHAGQVALLRIRKLDSRAPRKYMSPSVELYAGGTPVFYQHDVLDDPTVKEVIVTEGEFKALLSCQAWRSNSIKMPAVAHPGISYLPDALLDALTGKTVYLCYDSEQRKDPFQLSPGEDYTIRNGEKLTGLGAERQRSRLRSALARAEKPKRGIPVDQDEVDRLTVALASLDDEITKMQARNITVRVVRLPRPADVDKVDLDSFLLEQGPMALQALLDTAPRFENWCKVHASSEYRYEDGGIFNGEQLANYQARIVEDIEEHDGIVSTAKHRLAIRTPSGKRRTIEIAGDIWRDEHKAIQAIRAATLEGTADDEGSTTLRAIKTLSRQGDDPAHRLTFTCLGWQQIAGSWQYLMPDGGIGATGIAPQFASNLPAEALGNHYALAQVKGNPIIGAEAFKRLVRGDAGARTLALLLAGHASLALMHIFTGDGARPVLYPYGESGTYKSSFVRVVLSLFGPHFTAEGRDGRAIPKWDSTVNGLERILFDYRDTLVCIDDYKPATAQRDALPKFLHRYSEGTSRGRMTRDRQQDRTYPSRGMAIITGEDRPIADTGQLGRVLLVPVNQGDIRPDVLSELQRAGVAGHLAAFWRQYVQHLAGQLNKHGEAGLQTRLTAQLQKDDAALPGHQRTAGALRQNRLAWLALCDWMLQAGYLTAQEAAQLNTAHLDARQYTAEEQARTQRNERPSAIFLDIIRELVATGRVALTGDDPNDVMGGMLDHNGNPVDRDIPPDRIIGFWHGVMPALYPNVAYNLVQQHLGRNALGYSMAAIWQQLRADGVLLASDKDSNLKTMREPGRGVRKVLLFRPGMLEVPDPVDVTQVTDATDQDSTPVTPMGTTSSASGSHIREADLNVTDVTDFSRNHATDDGSTTPIANDQKTQSIKHEPVTSVITDGLGHQDAVENVTADSVTDSVTSAPPRATPPFAATPMRSKKPTPAELQAEDDRRETAGSRFFGEGKVKTAELTIGPMHDTARRDRLIQQWRQQTVQS